MLPQAPGAAVAVCELDDHIRAGRCAPDSRDGALPAPSTYGRIFNLGSGRRLSINQLAEHVIAAFDGPRTPGLIRRAPARSGEQRHVQADIRNLSEALGWQPSVPFDVGLERTCRWAEKAL